MPNHETFSIKPIQDFVKRYLASSSISVDLFARNNQWATYANDLNPATSAPFHMEANAFLAHLKSINVKADLVIVDPPYSPRQTKECYDSIGIKIQRDDTLLGKVRSEWKSGIMRILAPSSVVLWFGWNTVGMGLKNGFVIEEIMLVCHGSDHNDTICMAERLNPHSLIKGGVKPNLPPSDSGGAGV